MPGRRGRRRDASPYDWRNPSPPPKRYRSPPVMYRSRSRSRSNSPYRMSRYDRYDRYDRSPGNFFSRKRWSPYGRDRRSRAVSRRRSRSRSRSRSPTHRTRRSKSPVSWSTPEDRKRSKDTEATSSEEGSPKTTDNNNNNIRSVEGPVPPPDMEVESVLGEAAEGNEDDHDTGRKKINSLVKIVQEVAEQSTLSEEMKGNLSRLVSQTIETKSYKERAKANILVAGLKPAESSSFKTKKALGNPVKDKDDKRCWFPMSDMISSRVKALWRGWCGTETNQPDWDHESLIPPPKATNAGGRLSKPSFNQAAYCVADNNSWCDSGMVDESDCSAQKVEVPIARVQEWEKAAGNMLNIINMLEIFTASINQKNQKLVKLLKQYDDHVPEDVKECLDENKTISADCESQAKALQQLTEFSAWIYAETLVSRRDMVVNNCKEALPEKAKKVLRMQPFGGENLLGGQYNTVVQAEADRAKGNAALNQQANFKKGDFQKKGGKKTQKKGKRGGFSNNNNFQNTNQNNNKNTAKVEDKQKPQKTWPKNKSK